MGVVWSVSTAASDASGPKELLVETATHSWPEAGGGGGVPARGWEERVVPTLPCRSDNRVALRLERGSDPASWSEERGEGEGCMAVGLGEGSGRNSGRGVAECWRGGEGG